MLVAEGGQNNEIATRLGVSAKTVEWNLTRIYRKLGVRSRTELAIYIARAVSPGNSPGPGSVDR